MQALTLVAIVLLLAPLAKRSALAAILFVVAYNMSKWRHFVQLVRYAPKNDVIVLTFLLTVFTDLVVAVNVGVLLAALFMRRMAQSVQIEQLGPDQPQRRSIERNCPRTSHTLVLRMKRMPFADATAILTLQEMVRRFRKRGTRVLLCETNALVAKKLQCAGLLAELGSQDAGGTYSAISRLLSNLHLASARFFAPI